MQDRAASNDADSASDSDSDGDADALDNEGSTGNSDEEETLEPWVEWLKRVTAYVEGLNAALKLEDW
eukprot:1685255-Karenia_brevis.AAC.1